LASTLSSPRKYRYVGQGPLALTARSLVARSTSPDDLTRSGHLHVLRARDGGVLKQAGYTEAAVDLAALAGLSPAGVLCEFGTDNAGGMARQPELESFAETHGLLLVTVADLIRYRLSTERLVRRVAEARIPTAWGDFRCMAFESSDDDQTHLALVRGEPRGEDNVLVRAHSECLTGDVFGSRRCDCGPQLQVAIKTIADAGLGVIVYLRGHDGREIDISHKLRAYTLQDLERLDPGARSNPSTLLVRNTTGPRNRWPWAANSSAA
jgi:3,4-dihydroxy 2-butanone 4-phosphate synthase/GTP cyclohydrolase II